MNDGLSNATRDNVLDLCRPGIIEASAGTGKTYSLAEIYIALLCGHDAYSQNPDFVPRSISNPPSVREILVVTFTDAATNELTERLQKRIREAVKKTLPADASEKEKNERRLLQIADAEFDEASISTIHGFCMRMLRDFSFECGLPPTLVPAENLSNEILRFAVRFRTREALSGNSRILELSAEAIREIIEKLSKNPEIIPVKPENDPNNPYYSVASKGLKIWQDEREKIDRLSFDEILLRLRDALRRNSQLAGKIAARYKVALIDEFQDTDPVQWEIFKCIFIEQKRPFFCVGDPKQAIYEFRGGDVYTYNRATREILSQKPENRLRLSINWRSSAAMIAAFNALFRADTNLLPLEGNNIAGNLSYHDALPPPEKENDAGKALSAIFLRTHFNAKEANKLILEQLVEDIDTLIRKQHVPPDAIAVLVRTNEEINVILKELTKKKIPATISATDSVLKSEEARAIYEILEAILNPRNASAARRAATCEYFGTDFFEVISDENPSENKKFATLRENFFEALKTWESRGILAAFSRLGHLYAFGENLASLDIPSRRLANTNHILEILQTEAHSRRLSPQALFRKFSEMLRSPNDESEAEALRIATDAPAVKISTIHKSKGLQYEIVFLPSLWQKSIIPAPQTKEICVRKETDSGKQTLMFPYDAATFKTAQIERNAKNESCSAYVAFTRAKKACIVYHPERDADGNTKKSYISKLLEAAGILNASPEAPLPQCWQILAENDALPEIHFPKDADAGKRNSPEFLSAANAPGKDAWGISSFSQIIGNHEDAVPGQLERESAGTEKSVEADPDSKILKAPSYYDLAAGKQFGTLVHAIFEKLDFRTCDNLNSLIDSYKARFPQWLEPEDSRKKFREMFEATLNLPIDGKNAKLSEIDVSRDALSELEFFFSLKHSENLYSDLNNIFSSWGGIYKKTAEFHWANGNEGTLELEGLMHGYIDLVARVGERYYIADWKTNRIMGKDETMMSRQNLEDEIVECGYALQWAIYAVALRKYLKNTLGTTYSGKRNFGGISYFFVRWNTVFFDDSLNDSRLDALENILTEASR